MTSSDNAAHGSYLHSHTPATKPKVSSEKDDKINFPVTNYLPSNVKSDASVRENQLDKSSEERNIEIVNPTSGTKSSLATNEKDNTEDDLQVTVQQNQTDELAKDVNSELANSKQTKIKKLFTFIKIILFVVPAIVVVLLLMPWFLLKLADKSVDFILKKPVDKDSNVTANEENRISDKTNETNATNSLTENTQLTVQPESEPDKK